jgi:hypothetical protein
LANPSPAGVGFPSGPTAADTGGTADRLLEILLPFRDLPDARGQAARRAVALDWRTGADAEFGQPGTKPLGELPRQTRQPRRRQLLDADFEQELSIH